MLSHQLHVVPRQWRVLAWRLLHGSLHCNAFLASVPVQGGNAGPPYCQRPGCRTAGCPETLSHVFRDCPVVRPAVEWLRMLWQRVMGLDAVPELSAEALVADCDPAWHFPGDEAAKDLWTMLRLALLYATWVARCRSQ